MADSGERVTHYLKKILLACLVMMVVACKEKPETQVEPTEAVVKRPAPGWKTHRWSSYEVVRAFPHDTSAYTQGFLLSGGHWLESTGGYGKSKLRRVEKSTGKVLMEKKLDANFFGEGLAELNGKLYQLTWRSQRGFVYDAKDLKKIKAFTYRGEGWGLTTDGKSLIMSDGSDVLRYLDPETFRVQRIVPVTYGGKPVKQLNELEFIEGEVFANVWHTEQIVRINPANGQVVGVIDLTGIAPDASRRNPEFVLNGIAHDAATGALFVTGKCWAKIYQVKLIRKR